MVSGESRPSSWFLDLLAAPGWSSSFGRRFWTPFTERVDWQACARRAGTGAANRSQPRGGRASPASILGADLLAVAALYGGVRVFAAAAHCRLAPAGRRSAWECWRPSCAWPSRSRSRCCGPSRSGVAIGTNRRLAAILQPVVQVVASVPATALFPVHPAVAPARCPAGLEHRGRDIDADGHPVVPAVQRHRRRVGHPAGPARHDRSAAARAQ